MPAHTADALAQLQSLPLDAKVRATIARIRAWYEHFDGQVYVAFSGGKDSTALLHLVRSVYPDVPAVFNNTGVEFPEILAFVASVDGVVKTRPKLTFRAVVDKYGYPLVSKRISQYVHQARHAGERGGQNIHTLRMTGIRGDGTKSAKSAIPAKWLPLVDAPFAVSDRCCKILKHGPSLAYERETGRAGFVGTMATDSEQRALTWRMYGCNAFEAARPVSKPLSFWTEDDVWDFIRAHGIRISSIYEMGYTRTGCIFCGFGAHLQHPENRFQTLKRTHPKLWDYAMRPWEDGGLGMAEPLAFIGVPTVPTGVQMRLFGRAPTHLGHHLHHGLVPSPPDQDLPPDVPAVVDVQPIQPDQARRPVGGLAGVHPVGAVVGGLVGAAGPGAQEQERE